MAKTQIGAVIGIEGAKEYNKAISDIVRVTKKMQAEVKSVEKQFQSETKTLKQLTDLKEKLSTAVGGYTQKLSLQKDAQKEMTIQLEKAEKELKYNLALVEELQKSGKGYEEMLKRATKQYDENFKEVDKLNGKLIEMDTSIEETTQDLVDLEDQLKELEGENALTLMAEAWKGSTSKTGDVLKSIGETLTKYVTLPIIAGLTASVKVASDFQSAFTGVKKTVDEIVDSNGNVVYSYEDLERELRKIPLETASTYEDVMAVAEAAGQLAVAADQIPNFARNIIMLSDSTNIASSDAAVSIAQFMNIMGDGTETVDKFGSSLVALGNNTATDEASILALATRMASAGHQIGLTTPEILGLSAAMSAVGVTAEAGGTAMSTTIQLITKAVAEGTDDVEKFGKVTGMTAEEFSNLWRTKPVDALQQLLIGMGNLEGGGEELIMFMDELGWSGIRQSDLIRRLTSDYEGVTDAVELATKNYETNAEAEDGMNALTDEASKRYQDFASDISQFKESVKQLADLFGKEIIPVLQPLVDKATELITKFSEMDEGTKDNIIKFLEFVAVVGPVIAAIGNLMIWSAKLKSAFDVLKGAEGIAGVIGKLVGKGGLKEAIETLTSGSTAEKALKVFGPNTGLVGALSLLPAAFFGATAAANTMDKKMYESAEACEYVASRYHWSEEKVNQFGYTWAENGHLVALANDNMQQSSQTMADGVQLSLEELGAYVRNSSLETAGSVTQAFDDEAPAVQQAAHKFVSTGVEEIRDVPSETYSYGSEVATNFANGMMDNVGVVEAAANSIAGAVRAYLHFSEPDKGALSDFHTWMPDMMRNMANGIDANIYLVDDAISNVADVMSDRLSLMRNPTNNINMNNTFTINNGNVDERTVLRWADLMTDRVNENLGRMYG